MSAFWGIGFLFSCIKIVAILSMIGFGAYLYFQAQQVRKRVLQIYGNTVVSSRMVFMALLWPWLSLCLHSVV